MTIYIHEIYMLNRFLMVPCFENHQFDEFLSFYFGNIDFLKKERKKGTTIITIRVWGHGGGGKLKSSNDDEGTRRREKRRPNNKMLWESIGCHSTWLAQNAVLSSFTHCFCLMFVFV